MNNTRMIDNYQDIASCASEIGTDGRVPPDEILLIPAGRVKTRPHDGRPAWNNNQPDQVVAKTAAMNAPIKIDYNHASEGGAASADAGIAAGWINNVFVRDGAVWGKVEWTEKAAAHIAAREYRFISPTFQYRKDTRDITMITGAGLVNDPALYMTALASAGHAENPEPTKKDVLMLDPLLEKLGLKPGTDDVAAACAAIDALKKEAELPRCFQILSRINWEKVIRCCRELIILIIKLSIYLG